ncbi:hypothetical protein [Rhodanobacter terrae]|uniref:Uncharacterized protein n=1 Tax=Rhodanobacter terrae TaxID=418647 RepID=A0ABW0SX61_9GAMM
MKYTVAPSGVNAAAPSSSVPAISPGAKIVAVGEESGDMARTVWAMPANKAVAARIALSAGRRVSIFRMSISLAARPLYKPSDEAPMWLMKSGWHGLSVASLIL